MQTIVIGHRIPTWIPFAHALGYRGTETAHRHADVVAGRAEYNERIDFVLRSFRGGAAGADDDLSPR